MTAQRGLLFASPSSMKLNWRLKLTAVAVLLLNFTTVHAVDSCMELFRLSSLTVREELVQLQDNQIVPSLEMPKEADGKQELWTLSRLDDGERRSLTEVFDKNGNLVGVRIEPVSLQNEKYFYKAAGQFYEPIVDYVSFNYKGELILSIDGPIQIKLIEKHGIRPKDIFMYLKFLPKSFRFNELTVDHRERFTVEYKVYAHNKNRTIRFVFAHDLKEGDLVHLVSAYFIEGDFWLRRGDL
jgi:hypothetical protein